MTDEQARAYALTQYDEEPEDINPEQSYLMPCENHFLAGAKAERQELITMLKEKIEKKIGNESLSLFYLQEFLTELENKEK